jgi:hypothetical protein
MILLDTEAMDLPPDIVIRVEKDFGDRRAEARRLLLEHLAIHDPRTGHPRILRCIVFAAAGSIEKLKSMIELARIDWRDVIVAGEYEDWKPVRDLNRPFED